MFSNACLRITIVACLSVSIPAVAIGSQNALPGKYHACPVAGEGSTGGPARDPILNTLKNRATQLANAQIYQVAELIQKLPKPSETALKKPRKSWPSSDLDVVRAFESTEAQINGYLYDARAEGPEQPNCGVAAPDGDYHIWLLGNSSDDRTRAAVVEVTPRWRNANPSWNIAAIRKLAHDKSPVRITGWLLFDQEHPEQIGKTRGTLWELHPITKIEVYTSGAWRELSSSNAH